jgi:hypothetical protein
MIFWDMVQCSICPSSENNEIEIWYMNANNRQNCGADYDIKKEPCTINWKRERELSWPVQAIIQESLRKPPRISVKIARK